LPSRALRKIPFCVIAWEVAMGEAACKRQLLVPHLDCRVSDLPVRRPPCGQHLIANLIFPRGQVARGTFD
jgi:hypothetical protein